MAAAGRTSIFVIASVAALAMAGSAPGADPSTDPPGTKRITVERGGASFETVVVDPVQVGGRLVRPGSLIVRFEAASTPSEQAEAHRAAAASDVQEMRLPRAFSVRVRPGDEERALAAYRAQPEVAYAELDEVQQAYYIPNDTRFGELWGMDKINAPEAWDVTKSSNAVKIAVLDCGIYSSSSTYPGPDGFGHIDVRSKVVLEMNFSTSSNADDFCNHGTHVAGTAAASTNNGTGVAGVGHDAVILNGKVLGDDGSGTTTTVANGIVWAADQNAHVINLSLGSDSACTAITQDAVNYAWARGSVVVVAAGNSGLTPPSNLSRCANTLSVAATTQTDEKANFSNYGLDVDVAAPGVGILSSDYVGGYDSFDGTSMATPHVAGLAALVWTSGTASTNAEVVARITSTAVAIAGTGTFWTHGRVDAQAAVGSGTPSFNWAAQNSVDFDSDHLTDFGLYRGLSPADSLWFAPGTASASAFQIYFGATSDIPVPGDYDGDGKTDAVIYRPASGLWYGPRTGAAQIVIQMTLGQAGDIPIPGDYDGDGDTDPAIYRPSSGLFFGTDRTGANVLLNTSFGQPGDVPVPRDYDGDGETDPGIYRADATPEHYGLWYAPLSGGGVHQIYFGAPGDVPVPGDYDGDAKADSVIFRPSSGLWYGPRTGAAQIVIQLILGQAGDVPIPGYYDSNLATDPAIYRPSSGLWFSVLSGGGTRSISGLGEAGDKPIQKRPALAGGV